LKRFGKRERGFTLIELLVVVGIMAALAAIVVPNVAKFVGTGKSQGAAAEGDAVQAALDACIADNGLTGVTSTIGSPVTDFSAYDPDDTGPAPFLYPTYIRIATAKYGSDGLAVADGGTGWEWDGTGEVVLP
jgi:type IV pilus assembly protein PilA